MRSSASVFGVRVGIREYEPYDDTRLHPHAVKRIEPPTTAAESAAAPSMAGLNPATHRFAVPLPHARKARGGGKSDAFPRRGLT
jgi:hypothetical protein